MGRYLCLDMPRSKALPRVQLIVRATAQADVVDPRLAELRPRLNVVEFEPRASLTSSPGCRNERALPLIS